MYGTNGRGAFKHGTPRCRYQSYPPQLLVDLTARILALVPPYVRVYRVQRDIPMPLVSSGVEYGMTS